MYCPNRIESHSNIVFSNGLLDPWHGGGVLRDVSETVVALIIPEVGYFLSDAEVVSYFVFWGS